MMKKVIVFMLIVFFINLVSSTGEVEVAISIQGYCGDDFCDKQVGESCGTCPTDCGTCPNGGNGGGGGYVPPPTIEEGDCDSNWQCSNWSECIDGFQKRSCEDLDKCKEDYIKIEKRVCIPEKREVPEKFPEKRFPYWILILATLILIVLIKIIILTRKKKTKKKK